MAKPVARSSTPRRPRIAKSTRPTPVAVIVPDPQAIAARAYALFLDGGGEHGHDVEHWLRAERELRSGILTSAA